MIRYFDEIDKGVEQLQNLYIDESEVTSGEFLDSIVGDFFSTFDRTVDVSKAMCSLQSFRSYCDKELAEDDEYLEIEAEDYSDGEFQDYMFLNGDRVPVGTRIGYELNGEFFLDEGIYLYCDDLRVSLIDKFGFKDINFKPMEEEKYQQILRMANEGTIDMDTFDSFFNLLTEKDSDCILQLESPDEVKNYLKNSGLRFDFYRHVFTAVEGDNGEVVLLNGWHACNRLFYVLVENGWGYADKNGQFPYIEAEY